MNQILIYFSLAKEEWNKIIFPLKEQVRNAFISVLVVVSFVTLVLALMDLILSYTVSSFF